MEEYGLGGQGTTGRGDGAVREQRAVFGCLVSIAFPGLTLFLKGKQRLHTMLGVATQEVSLGRTRGALLQMTRKYTESGLAVYLGQELALQE